MSNVASIVGDTILTPTFNDSHLLELIEARLGQAKDQDDLIESLTKRNLELIAERNTSEKVVAELTELVKKQDELLKDQDEVSKGIVQVNEKLSEQNKQLSNQVNILTGENDTLNRSLKDLKTHGDPQKLITLNKKIRKKNEDLTKDKDNLQKLLSAEKRETKRLREDIINMAPEVTNDLCIYSNDEGEAIYLHPRKRKIKDPSGTREYVALRYWNNRGLGRLLTWYQESIRFADTGSPEVNAALSPSAEAQNFVRGWFKNNIIQNKQTQELRTR
ncbi:MAG: hypothetical protein JKY54_05510 [Flavobacteriales bacterium]|nr:hypothetical protein [Flavobacteriales bacterium]